MTRLQKDSHFRSKWGCKKENPCGEVAHFKGLRNDFSECFRSLQRPTVEITLGSPKKAHTRTPDLSESTRLDAQHSQGTKHALKEVWLPRDFAQNFALYRASKIKVLQTMTDYMRHCLAQQLQRLLPLFAFTQAESYRRGYDDVCPRRTRSRFNTSIPSDNKK